jgi:hypothetical protein
MFFLNSYWNLKSDNFQDYAQKPERNCTFMNFAAVTLPERGRFDPALKEEKYLWFFIFGSSKSLKALTDHLEGGSRVYSFDPCC